MKVLVAGGAGYLGSAVGAVLVDRGHVVIATSRSKSGFPRLDLADRRGVQAFIEAGEFDAIVNLAATGVTPGSASAEEMTAVNVNGAINLARAASSMPRRPWYVHVASSTEPRAGETPESGYSASKAAGTQSTTEFLTAKEMAFSIATIHNAYGPTQPAGRFVADVVRRLSRGEVVRIDHPDRVRDFCFVDDVVDHLASVAEEPRELNQASSCEIGAGLGTSLRTLAELACEVLNASPRLVECSEEPGLDHHSFRVAESAAPGFLRCSTPLRDGLRQVAAGYGLSAN
jgi:nucleoside-diphosphate-sugar epimerase